MGCYLASYEIRVVLLVLHDVDPVEDEVVLPRLGIMMMISPLLSALAPCPAPRVCPAAPPGPTPCPGKRKELTVGKWSFYRGILLTGTLINFLCKGFHVNCPRILICFWVLKEIEYLANWQGGNNLDVVGGGGGRCEIGEGCCLHFAASILCGWPQAGQASAQLDMEGVRDI